MSFVAMLRFSHSRPMHLKLLTKHGLVKVFPQGKHRYYSLAGTEVAAALEALSVLAGSHAVPFVPNTPHRLRIARSCYDHMAGALGVALHDCFMTNGWFEEVGRSRRQVTLSTS